MGTSYTTKSFRSVSLVLGLAVLMLLSVTRPIGAQARRVKTARAACEDCAKKDIAIRKLRNDVDNLGKKARSLEKDIDRLKDDKAKLQAELAGLKAQAATAAPSPPQPAPKRQVPLAGMAKMNAQQARSTAGSRLSGKVAIVAVDPLPNRPGQYRVTIVDPAALAPGGQSTTRPASGGAIVQGAYAFAVPPAFALTFHPRATMNIAGDVERVETLPPGEDSPSEIRLSLTNVQAGP